MFYSQTCLDWNLNKKKNRCEGRGSEWCVTLGKEARHCCFTSQTSWSLGNWRHLLTKSSGTWTRARSTPSSTGPASESSCCWFWPWDWPWPALAGAWPTPGAAPCLGPASIAKTSRCLRVRSPWHHICNTTDNYDWCVYVVTPISLFILHSLRSLMRIWLRDRNKASVKTFFSPDIFYFFFLTPRDTRTN